LPATTAVDWPPPHSPPSIAVAKRPSGGQPATLSVLGSAAAAAAMAELVAPPQAAVNCDDRKGLRRCRRRKTSLAGFGVWMQWADLSPRLHIDVKLYLGKRRKVYLVLFFKWSNAGIYLLHFFNSTLDKTFIPTTTMQKKVGITYSYFLNMVIV
jgi:hypothetical protein